LDEFRVGGWWAAGPEAGGGEERGPLPLLTAAVATLSPS